MHRSICLLALVTLLAGCATVKYADGQRVAIQHDNYSNAEWRAQLQAEADNACVASGGKAPAVMTSNVPVQSVGPAWLAQHTATFACGK